MLERRRLPLLGILFSDVSGAGAQPRNRMSSRSWNSRLVRALTGARLTLSQSKANSAAMSVPAPHKICESHNSRETSLLADGSFYCVELDTNGSSSTQRIHALKCPLIDLYISLIFEGLTANEDFKHETIQNMFGLDEGLFHMWVKIASHPIHERVQCAQNSHTKNAPMSTYVRTQCREARSLVHCVELYKYLCVEK